MSGHLIMAGVIVAVTVAVFLLGWHAHGLYTDREPFRPQHAKGDPAPAVPAVRELSSFPEPEPSSTGQWLFFGGWDQGPVAEPAEHDLLTATAEQPAVAGVDTPSDFIEGMTETVNAMISEWVAQGNVDRHTIRAGE